MISQPQFNSAPDPEPRRVVEFTPQQIDDYRLQRDIEAMARGVHVPTMGSTLNLEYQGENCGHMTPRCHVR